MLTFLAVAAYCRRNEFKSWTKGFGWFTFWIFVMALEEKFRAGVRVIQSLPKDGPYQPSNSTKLRFYGLYKQATEGKASGGRPSVFNIISRAKWDAWNSNGDMTKDEAMYEYIEELKKIIETMSFSGDVEEFLDAIGPFYEFVNLQGEDMRHIKEALDNWTSSSSSFSSSTNSSANNSPAKAVEETAAVAVNGDESAPEASLRSVSSTQKLNGHLPNNPVPGSSNLYTAPPAPVHRASLANLKSSTGLTNGHAESGTDEILEIDEVSHEYQIHREEKTSVDNLHSGTESDKYYSGDSEPEVDVDDRFSASVGVILSRGDGVDSHHLPKNNGIPESHSRSRIRSKVCLEGNSGNGVMNVIHETRPSSEYILQNTVERLNRDVDHILARVRILETAYATNGGQVSDRQMRRRRLFGDLSARSLTLIITWPFIAYFIIKLLKWWFMRRSRR